jgi:hypothetical protein
MAVGGGDGGEGGGGVGGADAKGARGLGATVGVNGRRGFALLCCSPKRKERPDEFKSSRRSLAQPCRTQWAEYCKEGT